MNAATTEISVGQLVVERPGRSRVFETLGIDYCCGGRKTLAQACRDKGLDLVTVQGLLDTDGGGPADDERDLSGATLTELADQIEQTHHAYLKHELPRLRALLRKVAAVHGERHPWLVDLAAIFASFAWEM